MNKDQKSKESGLFSQYWLVLLLITLVSALHYITPHGSHGQHAGHIMDSSSTFDWNSAFHGIYRRLYYFPIILAGFRGGTRGGLGAALLVVIVYLPHAFAREWGIDHVVMADPGMLTEKILEILLYLAMGLVAGLLTERLNLTSRNLRQTLDEKIAVENELVRSARLAAVGRLSAGLAHEIRNPLASIQGSAEVLADDFPENNPKRKLLDILLQETFRLNQVLSRFLDFARAKPGEQEIVDLVREVGTVVELMTNQKDIPQLVTNLPQECLVRGNAEQVRQILVNLILNAAAMSGPNSPITITVETVESTGRLKVTDQGPGFTSEAVENFGTPFFSTRQEGTGLGLATSLRTAENMNGSLWVADDLNIGACVVLSLGLDSGTANKTESEQN
jgi:two-component system, NtrC family, sensor histidine kinase HydH